MKVIAVLLVALATVSAGFIESLSGQIIGGALGQNVVSISFQTLNGQYNCAGSLIASTWVLSSAHCMFGAVWADINVGSNSFLNGNFTRRVPASRFIRHPLFNVSTWANDLGLIPVEDLSLEFGPGFFPLAFSNYTGVGQLGPLFGWRSGIPGQIIQTENVTVIECESHITDTTICSTPPTDCYLSGSPLTVNGELSGLASHRFEWREGSTCNPEEKSSFIKLSPFIVWLKQTIQFL